MKSIIPILIFLFNAGPIISQVIREGTLLSEKFIAPSIKENPGGEDPLRRLTVYLPPDYNRSNQHYPVIYFLHGFTRTDSFFVATYHMKQLLDTAISRQLIRPVIVVFPNSYTSFGGSFYTNSALTGNWADYIAIDVVNYTDKKFRTITSRESRGICGHSMGGNGALKLSMLFSDLFNAVYALSPARLDLGEPLTKNGPVFRKIQLATDEKDIAGDFFALEATDLARTYSPNLKKPPFFIDLPYEYAGDSVKTNDTVLKKWEVNLPVNMIAGHLPALRSLAAIKLDWGRNDQFGFIPKACIEFSKKLESAGIKHFAEEYIGDHSNGLGGTDGRIYNELLPFFNRYLSFEIKSNTGTKN